MGKYLAQTEEAPLYVELSRHLETRKLGEKTARITVR